jgi:hypothetical protein
MLPLRPDRPGACCRCACNRPENVAAVPLQQAVGSHTLDEPDTVRAPDTIRPVTDNASSARRSIPSRVLVLSQWRLVSGPPVPLPTITLLLVIVASPVPPADHKRADYVPRVQAVNALPAPETRLQSRIQNTVAFPVTDSACVGGVPDPKPCVGVVPVEVGGCQDPSRTVANQHFAARSWRAPFLPVRPPTLPLIRFPSERSLRFLPPRTGCSHRSRHRGVSCHSQRLCRRSLSEPRVGVVPVEVGVVRTPPLPLPTNTLLLAIVATVPPRATTNAR